LFSLWPSWVQWILSRKQTFPHVYRLDEGWFSNTGAKPKALKQIVDLITMVDCRSSNLLPNVGHGRHGKFEEVSVKVLAEIGDPRETSEATDPTR
jgi:alpha-L-fucosidase